MANAILTTTISGDIRPVGMPQQALTAILINGIYQLSYTRNFDNLAPSLASAIVPGAAILTGSPDAQSLLLSSTLVDLNDDSAPQDLFTVDVDVIVFVVYRIVIRNASTSLTTASVSFGWNDPTYNNVVANATYTELTGPTLETSIFPKAGAQQGGSESIFRLQVNTEQGAPATAIIDVFGYTSTSNG